MSAPYKHSDPTHVRFNQSADSSLLKKRQGYAEGGVVESPEDTVASEHEDTVDKYLAEKDVKEGEQFRVDHPDGRPRNYEYLGKGKGGRKDWLEVQPPEPSPYTS